MREQKLDLALQDRSRERHEDVRPVQITVPFRYLVFENEVVTKQIPSELADLAMVLMRVLPPMGQYEIRMDGIPQTLEPSLELAALVGEKAIVKLCEMELATGRARKELGS